MSPKSVASKRVRTYTELAAPGNELPGWLWQGFLAFGSIALLTSRWKAGKTTLLSVLISKLRSGGPLAGSNTVPAPALIVSEENQTLWVERGRRTPFADNVGWICEPFLGKPSREQWWELVQEIEQQSTTGPALVVFDTLAMVVPGQDENNAGSMINALAPLRRLSAAGHCVLLLHHPRKGPVLEARGSGALTGFVDIVMYLDAAANADQYPNRRWLRARGRRAGIIAERLIELNDEHTDYAMIDPTIEDYSDAWAIIEWVLQGAHTKCSRDDILKNWPEMRDQPHKVSLWKWLEQAVSSGQLMRDGEGRRNRPFRYWLPGRERYFLPDLPPLEPLEPLDYTPEISPREIEYAEQLVERDREKRRRGRRG